MVREVKGIEKVSMLGAGRGARERGGRRLEVEVNSKRGSPGHDVSNLVLETTVEESCAFGEDIVLVGLRELTREPEELLLITPRIGNGFKRSHIYYTTVSAKKTAGAPLRLGQQHNAGSGAVQEVCASAWPNKGLNSLAGTHRPGASRQARVCSGCCAVCAFSRARVRANRGKRAGWWCGGRAGGTRSPFSFT